MLTRHACRLHLVPKEFQSAAVFSHFLNSYLLQDHFVTGDCGLGTVGFSLRVQLYLAQGTRLDI